jgi:hypothetical protein
LTVALVWLGRRLLWTLVVFGTLLLPAIFWEYASGNVNSFVLLGAIAAWRWHRTAPGPVGAVLGFVRALKLVPAFVAWWLLLRVARRAISGLVSGTALGLLISVAGAGLGSIAVYAALRPAPSAASLAGLRAWWLPYAAGGLAFALAFVLRSRPAPSFAVAVVGMTVGQPAISIHTPALMLAALAPLAWPDAVATPLAEASRTFSLGPRIPLLHAS